MHLKKTICLAAALLAVSAWAETEMPEFTKQNPNCISTESKEQQIWHTKENLPPPT